MKKLVLFALFAMLASGCTVDKPVDLKSPCVGAAGSPCDRRPVNDWWIG